MRPAVKKFIGNGVVDCIQMYFSLLQGLPEVLSTGCSQLPERSAGIGMWQTFPYLSV